MSSGPDHRAGHDPRDLLAGAGQTEDGPGQNALAVAHCDSDRADSSVCGSSRTTSDGRADLAVGPLVLHAADASGDAGHLDDGPAGLAAGDRGQHDLAAGPADVRPLTLEELPGTAVGDPLQTADRMDDLREILQQEVVAVELHLDRVEHVLGVLFAGPDQGDELPVPEEDGPEAGALGDRRLAAPAGHGHREQAAVQHGLLDLGDHLQVVGRPRQVERLREVRFAEEPEAA